MGDNVEAIAFIVAVKRADGTEPKLTKAVDDRLFWTFGEARGFICGLQPELREALAVYPIVARLLPVVASEEEARMAVMGEWMGDDNGQ